MISKEAAEGGVAMLDITREKKDMLKRYLLNADPFLWDILDSKNKKGRIQELKAMGFLANYSNSGNPNYSRINQDLVVELGIEGVLESIVAPRVRSLFKADTLNYFRRCWEQGQAPTIEYLRERGLYRRRYGTREVYDNPLQHYEKPPSGYKDSAFVFFEIDTQHNFIVRWTAFAGLWFEQIETMLSSKGI